MTLQAKIDFPEFSGKRCLMMPFIQGEPDSVPLEFREGYEKILTDTFIEKGDVGFLTIDESLATTGNAHRGHRAKFGRALHTEAGKRPNKMYAWGRRNSVILERDVQILLANNVDSSCALWDVEHEDTSIDGDIGDLSALYPLGDAVMMKGGELHKIGILTPHESLPVQQDVDRQFLRIMSKGVHGRESHFTVNPLVDLH
jgi:hypothetical protein